MVLHPSSQQGERAMPITQGQFQKLAKWMADKNIRISCDTCGHTGFAPNDIVVLSIHRDGAIHPSETAPVLQMVCQNCGHIVHFAARPIGLL
jgi:predicted nucleic-acid-binding Zn-ribbon protein